MLEHFHILAFTHKNLDVTEVGKLHIEQDRQQATLTEFKHQMQIEELMFLSTCNRVEFLFCTHSQVDAAFIQRFFETLYPHHSQQQITLFQQAVEDYSGIRAVEHLLQVASSIDSMIVGEREIITQVRNAFESSKAMGLTGDFIRVVMRHTIETAKRVYTETSIANKPVSVVALAYHTLRDMSIPLDARVLMIGAGMTNSNMAKFLKKHGYKNFTVFNRTVSKGEAFGLEKLKSFDKGFDIIITCTGAEQAIITPEVYDFLLQGETSRKVVIDIAIPHDLDAEIVKKHNVTHISIDYLQKISDKNLQERSKEIIHVEQILSEAVETFMQIHKMRKVEIAMREVPNMVKDIRSTAMNEVFRKEIESLDDDSKEVLDKIIGYMEKKYMSMPMKLAKEIMLNS
jgi:glutamyl-tRNA reductase